MARRPFNPRDSVSEVLPQIRRQAGGSRAAESIGRALQSTSQLIGRFADRATKIASTRAGARSARETQGEAPELANPLTLAGESYNAAAVDVYRGQLESRAREDISRIERENQHDPAALDTQLNANLRGYVNEIPDATPQLKQEFQNLYARQKSAAMDRAFRRKTERLNSERRAAVVEQIEGRVEGMERIAQSAGVDADARDELMAEQASLEALLVEHGPKGEFSFAGEAYEADGSRSGIYSPEDIQQLLQSSEDRVLESRVLGTFRESDDPREFRDEFANDFTNPDTGEFEESPTTGLGRRQYESLLSKMDSELRAMDMQNRVDITALRDDVRDAEKLLKNGFTPGSDRLESLEARIRAAGRQDRSAATGLWEDLGRARDLYQFHHQIADRTPAEVERVIDRTRAVINEQGNQAGIQTFNRLEHAESLLSRMRTGLDQDPLGWANRVGVISLGDVQFAAEDPEQALSSMRRRRDQAKGVSQYYGVRPKYLTDAEADELTERFQQSDLDQRLALLSNLRQGFGDQSRRVFAQISDDVPVTAHIGGLLALDDEMPVDAHLDVARRALRGQMAMAEGNRVLPADVDLQLEIDDTVGAAMSHLPQTRSSLISTAEAIYTEHALRRGISGEKPNQDLWRRSLQEAAGAVYVNGERAGGGFAEFNGSQTIIPPEIQGSGQLEDMVESMTAEDLSRGSVGGEPPRYGNGENASPEDIADHGRLVPIDVGKYLVDMSDNGTAFLEGSGPDGHYVLDLRGILPRLTQREQATGGATLTAPQGQQGPGAGR